MIHTRSIPCNGWVVLVILSYYHQRHVAGWSIHGRILQSQRGTFDWQSACRPTGMSIFMSSGNQADESEGLGDLLRPRSDCQVDQMSGTDLAYLGDVVYELFVRSRKVWPSKRTSQLQQEVVALVRAEHQSLLLAKLRDKFCLTTKEQQVLSRGRNSVSGGSRNRRNPAAYQDSTALEALIGYLYITDADRCGELMRWVRDNLDNLD